MLATAEAAEAAGLKPKARVLGYAHAGVRPEVMGIGPVPAVRKLLERLGLTVEDFDVIESNEAFAAQALAVSRGLGLDPARVNPNGGAIALGHPVGATGAILTIKALYELERIGGRRGARHHVHRRRPGHRARASSAWRRERLDAAGGRPRSPADDADHACRLLLAALRTASVSARSDVA